MADTRKSQSRSAWAAFGYKTGQGGQLNQDTAKWGDIVLSTGTHTWWAHTTVNGFDTVAGKTRDTDKIKIKAWHLTLLRQNYSRAGAIHWEYSPGLDSFVCKGWKQFPLADPLVVVDAEKLSLLRELPFFEEPAVNQPSLLLSAINKHVANKAKGWYGSTGVGRATWGGYA